MNMALTLQSIFPIAKEAIDQRRTNTMTRMEILCILPIGFLILTIGDGSLGSDCRGKMAYQELTSWNTMKAGIFYRKQLTARTDGLKRMMLCIGGLSSVNGEVCEVARRVLTFDAS